MSLDVVMLIIPLLLMGVMYGLIVNPLWKVDQGNKKKRLSLYVVSFILRINHRDEWKLGMLDTEQVSYVLHYIGNNLRQWFADASRK